MSGWKTTRLSEFCRTGTGGTPSRSNLERYYEGGTIPWVKSGELRESVINKTEEHVTEAALNETNVKLVPAGALLLAMYGATVGRLGILGIEATTNQAVCHIIPDPKTADVRFMFHALSNQVSALIARSVGGAQPNISQGIIKDLELSLPPLHEQRRIAHVLDQAEVLRAKRRAALAQLDSLTQSIFLDLFGDPISNPKGWPKVELGNLLENIDSGWSPKCLDRPVENGEWGILKLGAVTWCEYDPAENKALPYDIDPDPSLEVKVNDLLFARKNTYELVAACALVRKTPPRLMMSDLIFRLRLRSDVEIEPAFLHQLLIFPTKRREIQKMAGGSAGSMPNISKGRLQHAIVEQPPISLQREFARRVAAVEKLKAVQRASLAELDALFASLQHRAFRGEL